MKGRIEKSVNENRKSVKSGKAREPIILELSSSYATRNDDAFRVLDRTCL